MQDRLARICLLPQPLGTPWSDPPAESPQQFIPRKHGSPVPIELPLFWYNAPWHQISSATADHLAVAVSQMGVLVSALRSDLGGDLAGGQHTPLFHQQHSEEQDDHSPSASAGAATGGVLPRIVPYRPERYGLSVCDFDDAMVIDVRLMAARDATGRLGFSPERIERWEAGRAEEPVAGGGWVPAAAFPPDVASIPGLANKFAQLRGLAPSAAVFASIGGHRIGEELPAVLRCHPDGLILRLDEMQLDGLQLAQITRLARQMIDDQAVERLPLWLVPGEVSADDAAKLMELGASAIAIDSWAKQIIEEAERLELKRKRESALPRVSQAGSVRLAYDVLDSTLQRFTGLWMSMRAVPADQRLACLSERWARVLNLPSLSLPTELAEDA